MSTLLKQESIIGLISDTHGLLRPQVIKELKGCDAIIHAGDICDHNIITQLETFAPVHAVAGNMDARGEYPASNLIEICSYSIYIIHDINEVDLDLEAAGINILIFGHTHQPANFKSGEVSCINPGSAGPERRNRPISMARMRLAHGKNLAVDFITLEG